MPPRDQRNHRPWALPRMKSPYFAALAFPFPLLNLQELPPPPGKDWPPKIETPDAGRTLVTMRSTPSALLGPTVFSFPFSVVPPLSPVKL